MVKNCFQQEAYERRWKLFPLSLLERIEEFENKQMLQMFYFISFCFQKT